MQKPIGPDGVTFGVFTSIKNTFGKQLIYLLYSNLVVVKITVKN